ncbi:hypothetical protein E5F05_07055 [Deinococcus metallilatus]|uniref:Uncharacterized protein n=2 Tax=Deinococcus TaxID=1298 RepID=A0AAJ5K674_9DEIO|nr:hypothetical protein [Deinococcus metallilatus]MBB5294706.1 hypothetical protein [Deinococcus metallilatus]QBY07735.1 hypothetical protein E5F05_07055 [Deinococcus metallilatus]RXJ14151.1 hypothetical protein ERJ73_05890 [Deinococcus metallilatus]TLK30116.1 hypothetical protein FCS05_06205 [Deinococcus metallilatus]GMA15923.1 hypothetical protein GCM10025871_22540 [Deinococcus metallilatus]
MKLFIVILVVLVVAALLLRLKKSASGSPRPPGTAGLDEETAARPDIDPAAVAAARARVSQAVPDEVLSDALLDATPKQLAHMFAAVPEDVMAAAVGAEPKAQQGPARAEDLAQLRKVGEAVDDLEIWSFGEKS